MSQDNEENAKIYFGPSMLAKGLVARLNAIGISPIERNDQQSAMRAGFGAIMPDTVHLFIRKNELEKAQPIIDTYLAEIGG